MRTAALRGLLASIAVACAFPVGATAEQASQPASAAAGGLDVGRYHACARLAQASLRCWGYGGDGALGYAATKSIGLDETPAAAGPVNLGAGRTARALSAGWLHTCAVLDDASVRCWGYGGDGRLGYGSQNSIGDDEAPAAAGPVNLGAGRTARAIATGRAHSCAVLDDGSVRCFGFGFDGRLGYGHENNIGDDELPGSVAAVRLGTGRTATAITAGDSHTCALLDDANVRCWGFAGHGQLGYGNNATFSTDQPPDIAGPVRLGTGRTAVAISAGDFHTCAVLDDGTVRCWGFGGDGRLGYGATSNIGDDETPASVGAVDLGAGRTAVAISAGAQHTCAVLDDGTVRCWGSGRDGRLGYANTLSVGDDEAPGSAGPVDLGPGRTAVAVSAGHGNTCARLDDGAVRCWGEGGYGVVGSCRADSLGDDERPSALGPLDLGEPGTTGGCAAPPQGPPAPAPAPPVIGPIAPPALALEAGDGGLAAQKARAKALRNCRGAISRRSAAQQRRARSLPARVGAVKLRRILRRAALDRRACLERHARTPGRVSALNATATGRHRITLTFRVSGTDGARPPAASSYLVKQSPRPIRTARDFRRAQALCKGTCAFDEIGLGAAVTLGVTDLRRRRSYHYAVAARDNVTGLRGPRSKSVTARTR